MTWVAVGTTVVSAAGTAYSQNQAKKNAKKASQQTQGPAWLEGASENAVTRADELSRRAYTPFGGQRVAGLSANEQQADRMSAAFGRQAMQPFNAKNLEAFQNPYLDQVLKNRQRVIGEEFGRQSADISSRQAAMDAFRTGRSDLARSRLNDSRMRAMGDAEAEARAGAFDTAMRGYFQNQENQRGAFDTAVNNLNKTGAAERSVRQAQSDFDYGQFLEKRDWDVNNLTPLLNAIGQARGGSTTTYTSGKDNKDYWGAAAGLLSSAINQWAGSGTGTQDPAMTDNLGGQTDMNNLWS